MPKFVFAILLGAIGLPAQAAEYSIEIGPTHHNLQLPSASAINAHHGLYWVAGDDAPWLYQLNTEFEISDKQLLKAYPVGSDGRIAKKIKPDFEAMGHFERDGQTWHLLIGSGSKAKTRELGFLISPDRKIQHYDLSALYTQISTAAGINKKALNIEGLAFTADKAILLNRGNRGGGNLIIALKQDELLAYLQGSLPRLSQIEVVQVKLPIINGVEAGFSDANYWPSTQSLVYSASLEGEKSTTQDGPLLGSFIGVIELSQIKAGTTLNQTTAAIRLQREGKLLRNKVEGIAIEQENSSSLTGAMACDNDDGSSKFFTFQLKKVIKVEPLLKR